MVDDVDFGELADALELRFAQGVDAPWSDQDFNAFALSAFSAQLARLPTFRAFCEARGRTPATVERWQDVPAVPARAFKHIDFAVAEPEVVFLTSGTTRGSERRGRHAVPRRSLYRAALLPPFRRHVLWEVPDGGASPAGPMTFLSLIPSPDEQPSSSLSFMVGAAAEAFAAETHWLVDAAGMLEMSRLRSAMREAACSGAPVLLLGTALALLHMAERLAEAPADLLPPGSRIMETGGFKGSGREIGPEELHGRVSGATGVRPERIVGEYGMTELCSLLYEPVLSEGAAAAGAHVPPPWLKVRALDPLTLAELAPGKPGLLAFFDLANAGSVCHVLTEDVGTVVDGRVRLRGRFPGAEPRGCSRAMDELMASARTPP